jgi:hypothetical protein
VAEPTQEDSEGAWEDEGGAVPEEKQTTPKGLEIPVPKRKDVLASLRKIIRPAKR